MRPYLVTLLALLLTACAPEPPKEPILATTVALYTAAIENDEYSHQVVFCVSNVPPFCQVPNATPVERTIMVISGVNNVDSEFCNLVEGIYECRIGRLERGYRVLTDGEPFATVTFFFEDDPSQPYWTFSQ